mmetsp:Transcript_4638/g.9795  ORF Transcript_4638/g.9795 Transcript_4638/m.9795 type:complete len:91 (+) Transcript_4638:163-435(+)
MLRLRDNKNVAFGAPTSLLYKELPLAVKVFAGQANSLRALVKPRCSIFCLAATKERAKHVKAELVRSTNVTTKAEALFRVFALLCSKRST